ncbi:MAG: hypothetical protein UW46_C0006G0056 [Candidatus Yanofskybacteria bacterium GW2011_GWF1_44_227]|uniref:DNA alkylation repair protein n=1 Tax=Candidatus Yanofskybacteria bacterium GW2011_GWE2_40_11 TaxID=1619033 RepID=A0A0G0TRK5_9BACT|nr:MAG: hypothetical protein UT69_C0002G0050 [Candidatus Yanofskybacteria bacterium GW2011_GWE1_40_10]KKR40502.1 MAG: hypothetical protein UT75_C0008G0024 [Candidatus Yanofskybacteria bacterium GW2011_GWE2_40_11]KKT53155.1 MAG: hypothetical protein UW46_C0006G0056 [Candidatus Yanofskybacteria bacterium GW2011_GWF1_44_227]OGN35497.1 MAG: DNA alkylation repair protein [Candidatus Yanofskybacteria bacterium RIFOXYA1_FULL_44_17]OGN36797.1 MAG: DNA alkylation repair protein [Candidatus Yanofskybacte
MPSLNDAKKRLRVKADPIKAKILQGFFKTAKGEYGYGDLFLGVTVPEIRKIAVASEGLSLPSIERLLHSKIHEERLLALLILVNAYGLADNSGKHTICKFYISNRRSINNWDLVDLSAPKIVGDYLLGRNKKALHRLAISENLWDRRISIISTYSFIRKNKFSETLKIARILLGDDHDLIHKAVGWMLREVGNRSRSTEELFLKKHYKQMPRTMLRYAIEKFPEKLRIKYLAR